MLDIKIIRENPDAVEKGLKAKNVKTDLPKVLDLDKKRRGVLQELDDLRAQKNAANDQIAQLKKEKKDAAGVIASMKKTAVRIDELEAQIRTVEDEVGSLLMGIPNLPHESVPVGGVDKNALVREWGKPKKFDFKPKDHIALGESLDILDFKRAAKISGSNFSLFKNEGALLERALINFMLNLHTQKHGYSEIFPPYLVNAAAMTGTGQLPKMAEDMYHLKEDGLYLIPTAEVPVTNLHADEILAEESLPIRYAAYTACFRREAGSYGKDTRGLMRVHQFDKVELVKFVKPENSYDELESLLVNAETVLQALGLPYRVLTLATGDLSFASAKTYDIEAYASGIDKWLEVSSCSNFEDFQARRAGIRFKGKQSKKPSYVHTLNGSGVALARTVIAILENYQTKEGEILIPECLQPHMNGLKMISRKE